VPKTIEELFLLYSRLPDSSERLDCAFKIPRLLSVKTVRALAEHVPESEDENSPWARLVELDSLRHQLAMRPELYRIGPGPIEQLMASGLQPSQIIEQCRSFELQALVAPLYLRCLACYGRDQVQAGSLETGVWPSRFATEAALAWEPEGQIDPTIADVVLAHLTMAFYAVLHDLDETIFCQSIELALTMFNRAKQQGDRNTLGRLCQSIGSLFSDIWTVPGLPNDPTPVNIEEWLVRPRRVDGIFTGLGKPSSVPEPAESLRTAIEWYRRALIYRSGIQRGLTYKAIVQTLDFLQVVLKQPIDERLFGRCFALAPELLRKHPDATAHLKVMNSIAKARGITTQATPAPIRAHEQALLDTIQGCFEPGDPADSATELRRNSHTEAMLDLERVLRHDLPFALYLRNFDYANEIRMLGDLITDERDDSVQIVVPQISYSLVDHKILQLFEEGVIAVCDPEISVASRLTLIPMLSLKNSGWLSIVKGLIQRCTRIVILLDELTPGVLSELNLLHSVGATHRVLVVTGQAFRSGEAKVPNLVLEHFPYIVDWIDFGFDEGYASQQHKAHGIIQEYLLRYVRADAKPTVAAWLHGRMR